MSTTVKQQYVLTTKHQETFCTILLLREMVNNGKRYPFFLEAGDQFCLKNILEYMEKSQLIRVENIRGNIFYSPTDVGIDTWRKFCAVNAEFAQLYDIFSRVDLRTGEFAFSQYHTLDPDAWHLYIANPRWEDLRVAVAQRKGIDPVLMTFLNLLMDERFDTTTPGWEFTLINNAIWLELIGIVNSNLHVNELGYGQFPGENVIDDVVLKGGQVLKAILEYEALSLKEDALEAQARAEIEAAQATQYSDTGYTTVPVEVVTEEVVYYDDWGYCCVPVYEYIQPAYFPPLYYGSYYCDPLYVSPIWFDPFFVF